MIRAVIAKQVWIQTVSRPGASWWSLLGYKGAHENHDGNGNVTEQKI